MAYTPINWQTGDTITAEKMNKMDNGWSVTTSTQTLFDDSVTTVSSGNVNQMDLGMSANPPASLIVTFNGTEYTCPAIDKTAQYGSFFYGGFSDNGPDFTEFPFALNVGSIVWRLYTETAGTYTLKLEADVETVETSDGFNKARGWGNQPTELFNETVTTTEDNGYYVGMLTYIFTEDPPETLVINFDGTEYTCQIQNGSGYGSAEEDYSDGIPFYLRCGTSETTLYTETAGSHTISASASEIVVTDDFSAAVNRSVGSSTDLPSFLIVNDFNDGVTNKTWAEINEVVKNGGICIFEGHGLVLDTWDNGEYYYITVSATNSYKFDPEIYKTAGYDSSLHTRFYKYNSAMP